MVDKTKRDFKWVRIPKEIRLNNDLSIMEKLFLVEIDSLDNNDWCFASNTYFAEFFWISKARCTQIIKSLEAKSILSIEIIREWKVITKRVVRILNRVVNKLNRGSKKIKEGYLENAQDNNTYNNNTKEEEVDICKKTPQAADTQSSDIPVNAGDKAIEKEVAPPTPPPTNKEIILSELDTFIAWWNKSPKLWKAMKPLPKTRKVTDKLSAERIKIRKEYSFDEVKMWTNNYIRYIRWLPMDERKYYKHRFTLYEFLKREWGLNKFINYDI